MKRKRLKRTKKLGFEKESGMDISKILEYPKQMNIKKVYKGLYSGEPIIMEDVFKVAEKPFERRK